MEQVFFMHRIKHTTTGWDKGIEVKSTTGADNLAAAKQAYHAYLGAYAYGNNAETDYVACKITDLYGAVLMEETWIKPETPEE